MKVLMITGDKNMFVPGTSAYNRALLQNSAVEELKIIFWGRGALSLPKAKGYDVVTVQDPFWRGLVGWIVARNADVRFNVQVHTDLSSQNFIRHVLAQIVLRHSDSIRVVSEKIGKQVRQMEVGAPIAILPMHVDVERFKSATRTPDSSLKTILWIGRLETEKDPGRAIAVLREVLKSGIKARLIMLGSGSMERDIKKLGENLPIELPGWKDPLPYLEKANVVLSTSLHESWGASVVEALAARVPVVSPDVGVAKEAGAIVVPKERLAEGVIEVLKRGSEGVLNINLLSKEDWIKKWRESL